MGLFESAGVTYSELVKKYNHFMVPAMKLTVGGKDITEMEDVHVSQISVQLSLEQACSASFTLEHVYDRKKSELHKDVKEKLQLGAVVTIGLGYGSSLTEVFWGYIHELQYAFDEAESISVTALDVRRLMMMNQENRTFSQKSYAEIFEEVIGKYSQVYQEKQIKKDAKALKIETVTQQKMSDYDFVMKELCKKDEKEFFVLAGTVYYQPQSTDRSPAITLTWGENLLSFRMNRSYCDAEIHVYGVDEKKNVEAVRKVVTEGKINKLTAEPLRRDIISTDLKDQQSVNIMAQNEADDMKKKSRNGSGACIGLPELVPGRYVEIKKLDVEDSDIRAVLTEVKHIFGGNGFTTEFELGG